MDLRRLKAFVTVAEHGTVSKAAQLLHITQPALSRQIDALERELGFKLFGKLSRLPCLGVPQVCVAVDVALKNEALRHSFMRASASLR